jgi:hypothetical protein
MKTSLLTPLAKENNEHIQACLGPFTFSQQRRAWQPLISGLQLRGFDGKPAPFGFSQDLSVPPLLTIPAQMQQICESVSSELSRFWY